MLLSVLLAGGVRGQDHPLPKLDTEPWIRVLLARTERTRLRLHEPARLEVGGRSRTLPAGEHPLVASAAGWSLGGLGPYRVEGVLRSEGQPRFEVEALPLFGDPVRLRLAGDLILHPDGDRVEVIERLRLEDYLVHVVSREMSPRWPRAALAAQAIVARSYAAARWMERHRESWHVHWHFGVDMAYPGWAKDRGPVPEAVAATRGEVLVYRGFPVLALFHASSGGRTESFARIKPNTLAPDGRTPIEAAMPVVEDPAALRGALGLDLLASHGRWKADLTLPEVTRGLQSWSRAAKGRPRFGEVEAVSVEERHADSGRVAHVSVRHRLEGKARFQHLDAQDFRMAVSPVKVRSLWWDRCVMASKEPGYLVLEGRGFGHGCGLSQVSAWQLARDGEAPREIVRRFYAGARIEKRY